MASPKAKPPPARNWARWYVPALVLLGLVIYWNALQGPFLFDDVDMEEELSVIFGRKVDLVSRRAVERSDNWIRRKAILSTAEPIYVAR